MKRRHFVGAAMLPFVGMALPAAAEMSKVPYSEKVYSDLLASGKPFMLDFYASW